MRRSVILLAPLLGGCATAPPRPAPTPVAGPAADYHIGCPDVLDVAFADRPAWDAIAAVDVDGTLDLGPAGRVPIDGLTADAARAAVAAAAGLPADAVRVSVLAPRAGRVFVTGPDNRRTRAVPYPGPVRTLGFLEANGAIQAGASELREVYVVRPHVAAGRRAEVFRVDAEAALLDGDATTDVELQPGDRVYVGETRRSSFARLLPAWAQPLYRKLAGLLP